MAHIHLLKVCWPAAGAAAAGQHTAHCPSITAAPSNSNHISWCTDPLNLDPILMQKTAFAWTSKQDNKATSLQPAWLIRNQHHDPQPLEAVCHHLHSCSFLKWGLSCDLGWGAVARAVQMSSGCSSHSLWATPAALSFSARFCSCARPFTSSTTCGVTALSILAAVLHWHIPGG